MTTRIEVYEIARPKNIVAVYQVNRRITVREKRREIRDMMRYLDPKKFKATEPKIIQ